MKPRREGGQIYVRLLTEKDATETYANWLNDSLVNQYLESRFKHNSREDVRAYIKTMIASQSDYLFGIFDKSNDRHIGNIKIGDINNFHKFGDIGLLIGEKDYWGKGIATEAIRLVMDYAFEDLHLNKVTASMYANNRGSYKAFVKNGFRELGVLRKHVLFEGSYVDVIKFEKLCEDQ